MQKFLLSLVTAALILPVSAQAYAVDPDLVIETPVTVATGSANTPVCTLSLAPALMAALAIAPSQTCAQA